MEAGELFSGPVVLLHVSTKQLDLKSKSFDLNNPLGLHPASIM